MSKDSSRLSRLGVLAPAALSACMDASVLAVPAAGAIVSTVLKELSKAFMLKKWFYGTMSAKEAEHLMMEKGKNGSFLVRESQARPGEYVLSVRVRGRVTHIMIRRQHNKYDVGSGEQFDDLVGLIEHFRSYPIVEASGDVLRLLQPLSGLRLRVHDIDKKVQQMQVTNVVENKCGFDWEFQSLRLLQDRLVFTTEQGMKPENANKNRYCNVLPYDQTRVILKNRDDGATDYINANYIHPARLCNSANSVQSSIESLDSVQSLTLQSESKKIIPLVSKSLSDDALKEVKRCIQLDKVNGNMCSDAVIGKVYIATQGCLPNTSNDFWWMVWQEDVRVIAMITNEVEKGKKKCERYWPSLCQEETYGNFTVKSIKETFYKDYLVRDLEVRDNKNCCRIVYQYQFVTWPDHGTPEESSGILDFIRDINKRLYQIMRSENAPEQSTICVHCSAGVGRTGTFIALDMLVDKFKFSGLNCDVDVHSTVKLVRAQRSGMVQNKAQYRFIYLALHDYIQRKKLIRTKMANSSDTYLQATQAEHL